MRYFRTFVRLHDLFSPTFSIRLASNLRVFTKEQASLRKRISNLDPPSFRNSPVTTNVNTDHAPTTTHVPEPKESSPTLSDISSQSNKPTSSTFIKSNDLNKIYNQENPSLPKLPVTCAGCGSNLHCNSPGLPGFIPTNEYEAILTNQSKRQKARFQRHLQIPTPTICIRCRLLKEHKIAAMSVIKPSCYDDQIASVIRTKENTSILVVADMVNLPHSLIPDLHEKMMGSRYVLIGNKVDQLPIDGPNFLDRWRQTLVEDFKSRCNVPESMIYHVCFISALTGYGVSDLIDFLLSRKFQTRSPVYLVGSTNVGKSSLFNRLILSDFCKAEARETIHRATISVWPGTTTGLLSFPITLLTNSAKYAKRIESLRLRKQKNMSKKSVDIVQSYGFKYLRPQDVLIGLHDTQSPFSRAVEKARNTLPDLTEMPTYSWESKTTNTDSACLASEYSVEQLRQDFLPGETSIDESSWEGDMGNRLLSNLLDPRHFNNDAWCYDTPGFICQDQILNYLPPKDLVWLDRFKSHGSGQPMKMRTSHMKLGKVLVPRTFVLRPGLSLLLGRLARLDLVKAAHPVYLTTFSHLPVHIVNQSEVGDYLIKYAPFLGPGCDDEPTEQRHGLAGPLPPLKSIPLEPLEMLTDLDTSIADVVLSGAGWISVACSNRPKSSVANEDQHTREESFRDESQPDHPTEVNSDDKFVLLHAWTPGGFGIYVRKPPLIRWAIKRRGVRIPRLREFTGLG